MGGRSLRREKSAPGVGARPADERGGAPGVEVRPAAECPAEPRLTVVALVFIRQRDSILLVRQRDGARYWSLPGGKVERGESLEAAAVREVREETGLEVRLQRVVGLYSKPEDAALAVTLAGEVVGGELMCTTDETSDCRYFRLDRLPEPVRAHLHRRVEDYRLGCPAAFLRTQ